MTGEVSLGAGLEFSVHELTGTCRKETGQVLELLGEFDLLLEEQGYGSRMYRRLWRGSYGVSIESENKMGSKEVRVRLPGQACENLGLVTLLSLATLLELKVTRLDGAIDYCPFSPRDLFEQREAGNTRTHAQGHRFESNGEGDTFSLGSRSSGVFLRCYNKRGFTRVELEMKRGHAQEFLAGLFGRSEEEYPELFLGALRCQVDFVDATQDENISRAPLLPFWSAFVGMFRKIRLAPPRVPATVDKYIEQGFKQMGAMFYTVAELLGCPVEDLARNLYELGRFRLKTRHRLLLEEGWHGSGSSLVLAS